MAAKNRKHRGSEHESQNPQQKAHHNRSKGVHKRDRHKVRSEKDDGGISSSNNTSKGRLALIIVIAVVVGYLHGKHVSTLFENDRFFSHLSDLEREMTFRTEMGLYYSYYKTMIQTPTFLDGLNLVMKDNISEYPDTINVLKRFNLYPEVVLAASYRIFDAVTKSFNIKTKFCFVVNRGEGLSPVPNCEGIGDPAYFYISGVFIENGLSMSVFFLYATYLSKSIMGGILAVLCFFYNHGEATRVQWTPPLRESFAYPFFLLQMFIVTYALRIPRPNMKHTIAIAISTICFMLPWQFAQFALLTQTMAVFGCYVLGYIGSSKIKCILFGQFIGLFFSYHLMFGNEMLLTSFYASCLLSAWAIVYAESILERLNIRLLIWLVQGILLVIGTMSIKTLLSKLVSIEDDAHIFDIFKSKFSDYKDFNTMLYTCAAEFDFMERETPWRFLKTLLLPSSLLAIAVSGFWFLRNEYYVFKEYWYQSKSSEKENSEEETVDRAWRSKPNAEVLYNLLETIAFTIMALIIMRLKLFFTPQLCLMSSLLASRQFFGRIGDKARHYAIVVALIALMSIGGIANLQHQWSIKGEYSNLPQEQLLEWVKANTSPSAVFAGAMPTMASIKLSTGRPIVNHPHFENAGLRRRTKDVYKVYSRKSMSEVKLTLESMGVDYLILEESWCLKSRKTGCSLPEIWDLEDKENLGKPPVCLLMVKDASPYFKEVYKNNIYIVFMVHPVKEEVIIPKKVKKPKRN